MLRWRPRLLCSIPLVGAALMLQGCLAAAIPVLAGSALATRDVINDGFAGGDKQKNETVEVAQTQAPAQAPAQVALATPAAPGEEVPSGDTQRYTVLATTELPAPVRGGASPSVGSDASSFASFARYAESKVVGGTIDPKARTATLAKPAALDGVRSQCGHRPPAVLVDLDPQGRLVPTEGSAGRNEQLGALLAQLRRQDITIGWISGRFADDAPAIRRALATAQLDALGEDTLLLMRYADDRKQTRRLEFAKDYCLVAIAGDERSDFDELYNYLKNPDQAVALEPLYGNGWFLTPSPLIQE